MKILKHSTLSLFVLLIFVGAVATQQPKQTSSDDLLRLRNFQYEQAKRILRMQELKSEFDRLNSEQQQFATEISNWIKEQAKIQNVDLTTHKFDFDQLKFVEIKKNENK